MRVYRGLPGGVAKVTVQMNDGLPRVLRYYRQGVGFGWGNGLLPASHLAFALAASVTGNEAVADKVHLRLKHRLLVNVKADQPWTFTDAEILQHISSIQEIETSTAMSRRMVAQEPAPVVMEGGLGVGGRTIQWDPKTPAVPTPAVPTPPTQRG